MVSQKGRFDLRNQCRKLFLAATSGFEVSENCMQYLVLFQRGAGLFIFGAGVAEIGIGVQLYLTISGIAFGSWWGAVSGAAGGLLGMIGKPYAIMVLAIIASVVSFFTSLLGAAVDGVGYRIFAQQNGCYNTRTGVYTGQLAGQISAYTCIYKDTHVYSFGQYPYDCACSNGTITVEEPDHSVAGYTCYYYQGRNGKALDCSIVTGQYTTLMRVSLGLSVGICIMSLVFAVVGSLVLFPQCSYDRLDERALEADNEMTSIVLSK